MALPISLAILNDFVFTPNTEECFLDMSFSVTHIDPMLERWNLR
jgi:hypothetical protein